MARCNLKMLTEAIKKYGITDIQVVISDVNPKNSRYIIVNGNKISTAQWGSFEIEDFFSRYTCMGTTEKAQGESVASQKVSTAWGKNALQTLLNQDKQGMTYADNWGSLIQLKGQELKRCLAQMVDITENSKNVCDENMDYYKTWVQHVISFYDNNVDKAKNVVMDLIKTNKVYIIREHIYTNSGLYEFIKNWYGENDIKISKEDIQNKVNEWVALVA